MAKPDEKCCTCRFGRVVNTLGTVECRANAPQPVAFTGPAYGNAPRAEWPEVGANDWCGEYVSAQEHVAGARESTDPCRALLVSLDKRGGLGLDVHDEIQRVLEMTDGRAR